MKLWIKSLWPNWKKVILSSILTIVIPLLYNYLIAFFGLRLSYFPIIPELAILLWIFLYLIVCREEMYRKFRWNELVAVFIISILLIFWMAIFKNKNSFYLENFILFFLLVSPFVFSTIITYVVLRERKKIGFTRIGIAAGGVLSLFISSILWIFTVLFSEILGENVIIFLFLPFPILLLALLLGSFYSIIYKKFLYKRREIKNIFHSIFTIITWVALLLVPWIFDYIIKVYHLEKKLAREVK